MIRRALIDVDVLLDVLAEREPLAGAAARVWSLAERRRIAAAVLTSSLPNCYYVLRRAAGPQRAKRGLGLVRGVFELAPLDAAIVDQALASAISDFEDAIQACAALRFGADCIVTRDTRGFRKSQTPAMTPEAVLAALDSD